MIHSHTPQDRQRPVVMVFAKAPLPNLVKTRLIPRVGPAVACRLHEAFVRDTLHLLADFDFDIELHTDQPTIAWPQLSLIRKLQSEGDLGHRMLHALQTALSQQRKPAMILGGDSPTLPSAYVHQILQSPADVCLGPADDGGYYAISCRRVAPDMFNGVTWSCQETRAQTVDAARRAGLTVAFGPPWYDVDSSDDLDRLIIDPRLSPATRATLAAAGILPPNPPSAP